MYLITVADLVKDSGEIELINEVVFSHELYKHESKAQEVVNELNTKYVNKYFIYVQCTINDSY